MSKFKPTCSLLICDSFQKNVACFLHVGTLKSFTLGFKLLLSIIFKRVSFFHFVLVVFSSF